MFETQIIDDILTEEEQKTVYQTVLRGKWRVNNNPPYPLTQWLKSGNEVFTGTYETVCVPLLNKVIDRLDLKVNDCVRACGNLQLPLRSTFFMEQPSIHIDAMVPHIAAIYYVNDTDGNTILYSSLFDPEMKDGSTVEINEVHNIQPKMGRLVIFDGFRYHADVQPKTDFRCVLEFGLV